MKLVLVTTQDHQQLVQFRYIFYLSSLLVVIFLDSKKLRQVESTKENSGCIKFGTGYIKNANKKQLDISEPRPGPGSYRIQGGTGENTSGFSFRNAPKATISGRTKFGSPF